MNFDELKRIQEIGNFLFHGSDRDDISDFEPRQAYTIINGENVKDDRPAVHATPFCEIAIAMAIINNKNCKDGFEHGFEWEDGKPFLYCDERGLKQINKDSKGFVYCLRKSDFKKRGELQYISYKRVGPVDILEVNGDDLRMGFV